MAITEPRYTRTAVVLHWLVAVLIIGAVAVGAVMDDLPRNPTKLLVVTAHKWTGIVVLLLTAVRLAWRATHRPPAAVPMPAWQARAATAAHVVLYGLCVAVPLAGWAMSSASGYPVVLFGVLPLPDFVPVDDELHETLEDVHGTLAWTLAALVALHAAAALKHHFLDRDGLLRRMALRRH